MVLGHVCGTRGPSESTREGVDIKDREDLEVETYRKFD